MDFLDEDSTVLPSQKYALISVVSETTSQKSDKCALKIKGVFGTKEEAQMFANKCMQLDSSFDIYLVETGKWLPIPPNNDEIQDEVHQNKQLNEIIKGYKEQQLIAKQHYEERKKEQIEDMLAQNLKNSQLHPGESISSSSKIDVNDLENDVDRYQLSEEQISDLKVHIGKPLSEEEFKSRNEEDTIVKVP